MSTRFITSLLAFVVLSHSLEAQSTRDAAAGVSLMSRQPVASQSPALVAVASAILPGAGQAIMRQKRSVVYLALEAAGIGYYVSQHRLGERERTRYRNLSRSVARAAFSPDGPAGTWDYYERMEKYVASGEYDVVAGGSVDPEPNADTFNGAMWLLARQTYWRDAETPPPLESAEYRAALEFYTSRAVTPEFRWSWTNDPGAFQQYRSAIASSNNAFRHAEQIVSVLIANHFLSAVDAYASLKLRMRHSGEGAADLVASWPF
jgi:hypothetical protein